MVLEKIVHNKLSRFFRLWWITNPSGFKKADGTVSQLACLTQEWPNPALGKGKMLQPSSLAFDRVWHEGFFTKLRSAGTEGAAYKWIISFLADWNQVTVVNGSISTSARLFAGVPQGAILSPLLLSIYMYMNEIPFQN